METDTEKLFLAKDGERVIFIEKCPTQQSVIDGIRLLYRLFVKKKPGLIINDTSSYGMIQTVLFVKAVHPLLERQVLILCDEGKEAKWKDHFDTLTDMADDVVIDSVNPFATRASVYINPLNNVAAFYSRVWSIVVLDTDKIIKEVLKDKLNTTFKIWLISVDVKENLQIFSQVYKWLYPKESFDECAYKQNLNNPRDFITKAIMLDAIMEDVVWKNDNDLCEKLPQIKITRKNKDATGAKIKRTKRKVDIIENSSPNKAIKNNGHRIHEISVFNSNIFEAEMNEMVHKEPTLINFNNKKESQMDTNENSMDLLLKYDENTESNSNILDVLSNNDVSVRETIIEVCDNSPTLLAEEVNSIKQDGDQDLFNQLAKEVEIQHSKTNVITDGVERQDLKTDIPGQVALQELISNEITEENESQSLIRNGIEDEVKMGLKPNESLHDESQDFKANEFSMEIESHDLKTEETNLQDLKTNEISNRIFSINIAENGQKLAIKESEDIFSEPVTNEVEKNIRSNKDDSVQVDSKTVPVMSELDLKIKQMEEQAMKKFKGSFLDSMF